MTLWKKIDACVYGRDALALDNATCRIEILDNGQLNRSTDVRLENLRNCQTEIWILKIIVHILEAKIRT